MLKRVLMNKTILLHVKIYIFHLFLNCILKRAGQNFLSCFSYISSNKTQLRPDKIGKTPFEIYYNAYNTLIKA